MELNIILQTTANLYKLAQLEYLAGNLKETLDSLTQKAEIQDKACHLLQRIIEDKIQPKKKHMTKEDFKNLMRKMLIEQANTFSILVEKLLEGGQKKDTLQVIKVGFNHINSLIQLQLLEESNEVYHRFLINVAMAMYHYGFDELLGKELERIEKLNPQSASVRFDYLSLLQKVEGGRIGELKECFEEVKMLQTENVMERLEQLRGMQIKELLANEQLVEAGDLMEEQLRQNLGVVRRLETLLAKEDLEQAEKLLAEKEHLRSSFGSEYLFRLAKKKLMEDKVEEAQNILEQMSEHEAR